MTLRSERLPRREVPGEIRRNDSRVGEEPTDAEMRQRQAERAQQQ